MALPVAVLRMLAASLAIALVKLALVLVLPLAPLVSLATIALEPLASPVLLVVLQASSRLVPARTRLIAYVAHVL